MRCDVCGKGIEYGYTDGCMHVHEGCMPRLMRSWSVPVMLDDSEWCGVDIYVWSGGMWTDSGFYWTEMDGMYLIAFEKYEDRGHGPELMGRWSEREFDDLEVARKAFDECNPEADWLMERDVRGDAGRFMDDEWVYLLEDSDGNVIDAKQWGGAEYRRCNG